MKANTGLKQIPDTGTTDSDIHHNAPVPGFLMLVNALLFETGQSQNRALLQTISNLVDRVSHEIEKNIQTRAIQQMPSDNSRINDLVTAIQKLSEVKKQLPDPKKMNLHDFKKHMDYGRVINQLTTLKLSLEKLEMETP